MERPGEDIPFLARLSNEKANGGSSQVFPIAKYCNWKFALSIAFVLLNFTVLIGNIYCWSHVSAIQTKISTDYSPVDTAIEYEDRYLETHLSENPFAGKPRPEFDEAWNKLLRYSTIEVTGEELRRVNKTSLRGLGSDRYLAYISAYHQLHCVKRMVQTRYPEYYPELVAIGSLSEWHFNHCVEVLRQAIMCHGDTHLNTYQWDEKRVRNYSGASSGTRRCVNWSSLEEFAETRMPKSYAVEVGDGQGIVGPQL